MTLMRPGCFFLLSILSLHAAAKNTARPKLVVHIVVSQMRYDYLEKFGNNFSEKGFKRFLNEGVSFTDFRYDYMLTGTETSLATLTTGAMPSTHGVVGPDWVDFLSGKKVALTEDRSVRGLECDASLGCFSPANLIIPTLGDRLLEDSPSSKVVTVAHDASSAVVMAGFTKNVYWCDQTRGKWISSSHYMSRLPQWVVEYNDGNPAKQYVGSQWELMLAGEKYVNSRYSVALPAPDVRFSKINRIASLFKKESFSRDFPKIYYTPDGNTLLQEFVRKIMVNCDLGRDEHPDLLNICFDTPRLVGQMFGPESVEVEDMFYRLDADIGDLLDFVFGQIGQDNVVAVLTSDHGASDSFDRFEPARDRFNIPQFKVICNGFMNAQYGPGDWVADYCDRQLYLNRDLVYRSGLNLEDVQNRLAAFVLQFRGVSHAMTSTALSSHSFATSYGRLIQNSFYPRRSGDVVINLMPGWIEEQTDARSLSGSMYDYDTHIPLLVMGGGFTTQRIRAPADPTQLAPTLARLMRINRPVAAMGDEISALTDHLDF